MKTLYKVVKTFDRTSIFASGRYQKTYHSGSVVEAIPNTLGLMCFKHFNDADAFSRKLCGRAFVIKVKALAPVFEMAEDTQFPQDVSEYALDYFYISQEAAQGKLRVSTIMAPRGTVLCHKIRVLE